MTWPKPPVTFPLFGLSKPFNKQLSPSQLSNGLEDPCILKIVSNKMSAVSKVTKIGKQRTRYLPDAGSNILGTVIHNTIDEKFKDPSKDALQIWKAEIANQNNRLQKEPLNQHFYPLEHSKNYLNTMYSTLSFANSHVSAVRKKTKGKTKKKPLFGSEITVFDGPSEQGSQIKGKIDFVERKKGTILITDWKSGRITVDDGKTNPGYEKQIMLYAALHFVYQSNIYPATSPVWPKLGRLKNPTTQEEFSFDLIEKDSLKILKESQELHLKIAKILDSDNSITSLQKHAKPSLKNCKFCPVRPSCATYRNWLTKQMKTCSEETEPDNFVFDIIGTFREVSYSSSSEEKGCIIFEDSIKRVWRVSDIDFKASRNLSTLKSLKKGAKIMIFNISLNHKCILSNIDVSCKANLQTQMIYSK